jgi:hypothetical protein
MNKSSMYLIQNLTKSSIKNLLSVFVFALIMSGCASGPPALMAAHTPEGALYLAEVTGLPEGEISRNDVLKNKAVVQWLLSSGIPDRDITDGSIQRGRIFCCGGPNEGGGVTFFFKPAAMQVNPGDIVEIRAGSAAVSNDATSNRVNIATRKIMSYEDRNADKTCWWDPENPALWQRVLYCNWMLSEGWIQGDTFLKSPWYKHTTDQYP